ncbi:hypothetical protein [Lapidilactobacillus gannanensis]|uniref:ABC transporter substrate-binding protein n=1 Tax=Lapidilactobacillus gannanensis TaxID=2486002 RepID=A0ABW4BJ91_9LACO|nr:hypothetical protein [Lapidilactobacillus gannanensis]
MKARKLVLSLLAVTAALTLTACGKSSSSSSSSNSKEIVFLEPIHWP